MPSHHFGDRSSVGRMPGRFPNDGGDFAKVVRAENAGSHDGEPSCVCGMIVVEAVDRSPRYTEHLARAAIACAPVDRPREHPFQPIDRLLVAVMTVRNWHLCARRDIELENSNGTSRR